MEGKTALIVDDDSICGQTLLEILSGQGFLCSFVRSGREAQLLLGSYNKYGIALVDICMPGMYGTEAVELSKVFGNRTPILFMSGLVLLEENYTDIKGCPFIEKPFSSEELLEKIESTIDQFKRDGETH